MLKNLFTRRKDAPVQNNPGAVETRDGSDPASGQAAPRTQQQEAVHAALMRFIAENRASDPLVGPKLAAKELLPRLTDAMKTERGVHVESLLCLLGSLAGYACQASLRAKAGKTGLPETAELVEVEATSGKKYFFGDPLNRLLAESQYSVWSLAAGTAQQQGCKTLPDIGDIFAHVSRTVGDDTRFGIPRIPEGHTPGNLPVNYVKDLWPATLKIIQPFCQEPEEWPVAFGLALQNLMVIAKDVITPDLALTVVMESAIPMSKVDLATA